MKGLIVAGGTGGHVYPALSVAKDMRNDGTEIYWLGKANSLESNLAIAEGFSFIVTNSFGFKGKSFFRKWLALLYLEINFIKSIFLLIKIKPDFIFSTGGYISLAPGLASAFFSIPLFIHEQNSVPGLVNRILNRFSKLTFEGFPEAFNQNIKIKSVGNPVRSDISGLDPSEKNNQNDKFSILILGGSQGSKQLNEIIIKSISKKDVPNNWEIVHQIGDLEKSELKDTYLKKSIRFTLLKYIEDMASAYNNADIIISRSGAMTVSEICCASRPSILFPLPWAADNHQYFNAKYLEDKKASILLESSIENADRLFELLKKLEKDDNTRLEMGKNAYKAFPHSSTSHIKTLINESI